MNKSFSQAPKPPQLTAEQIAAFERGGPGQDTRHRVPTIVENREPTNVETREPASEGSPESTKVEAASDGRKRPGVSPKPQEPERTKRLSIDLPESWHRRFKVACAKTDKKMIDEVADFIKRRTMQLEKE